MVTRKTKPTIVTLDEGGVEPTKLKVNDAIAPARGRVIIVLVDTHGKKTAAGEYWGTYTNRIFPSGGFQPQTPIREGNTETIMPRSGKKGVTPRWATEGEFNFSKLGDKYYSTQMQIYVVQVPVKIQGKRRDGTTYTTHSHLPVERLGLNAQTLPLNMSIRQRDRKLQEIIMAELPAGALYKVSKEVVGPGGRLDLQRGDREIRCRFWKD